MVIYLIALDGASDPMSMGAAFAFFATILVIPIALIVEAIIISKKGKKNEAKINWIIAMIFILVILVLIFSMLN
jgi:membrane protease YdiL (CAAX protease family)